MRRTQVLAGMLVFGLGAFIFAIAPDYKVLVASRIVMGLGASLIGPVLVALGAELVAPKERGSAIATILLGVSMASMVGIPLATWVASAWGARLLFMLVVPNEVKGADIHLRQVARVLTEGKTLTAFLVVFFITSGVYDMYAFISPIIRDRWQGDISSVSIALAVIGIADIVGNLFVTRAARHYSAEQLLVAGLTLLVADMLIIILLPAQLSLLYILLVVWAFSTDLLALVPLMASEPNGIEKLRELAV